MKKMTFKVEERLCEECSMALRRFIGNMDGVESVDVEDGKIAVQYDAAKMREEHLSEIATDSLEKLGHRIIE